jgi:hypothetical protein
MDKMKVVNDSFRHAKEIRFVASEREDEPSVIVLRFDNYEGVAGYECLLTYYENDRMSLTLSIEETHCEVDFYYEGKFVFSLKGLKYIEEEMQQAEDIHFLDRRCMLAIGLTEHPQSTSLLATRDEFKAFILSGYNIVNLPV